MSALDVSPGSLFMATHSMRDTFLDRASAVSSACECSREPTPQLLHTDDQFSPLLKRRAQNLLIPRMVSAGFHLFCRSSLASKGYERPAGKTELREPVLLPLILLDALILILVSIFDRAEKCQLLCSLEPTLSLSWSDSHQGNTPFPQTIQG